MSWKKKIIIGAGVIGGLALLALYASYLWVKQLIEQWLATQGISLTRLERALVKFEAYGDKIIGRVFAGVQGVEDLNQVGYKLYDSINSVSDEEVRSQYRQNGYAQKDVMAMFQS